MRISGRAGGLFFAVLFFICPLRAEVLPLSPDWLALVHYRPALFGGVKSTIDSPNFFLASDGKTNPAAELQATIDLFNGSDTTQKCLFPARYLFLKKNGIVKTPFPACPEYDSFKTDLKPQGITLLYTDAYMNNPASLFGHTLMRIDVPEGKTQLVAHGMNYGAVIPPDTNGVLFAILGLTGGYWGSFTVKPYYNVINMYNNIENRDIWEFHLNLTRQEIDFFVAHLWEVGQTQTRYFFFSENCSYLLMEILDAVRPDLKLADDFPAHAIPLDTLKAVMKRTNLIDSVNYRPSRQKRIESAYRRLSEAQREGLLRYWETEEPLSDVFSSKEKADILEVAYEYAQYKWEAEEIELSDYRRRSLQILRARTALDITPNKAEIQTPSPMTAHDSKRLTLAQGWERGEPFQEISYRPAYHSLSDKPEGLRPGSEINFLNGIVRFYLHQHKLIFQHLDFVQLNSVSAQTALFHPISYRVNLNVHREGKVDSKGSGYIGELSGGSGITFEPWNRFFVYGLTKMAGQYGGILPHNAGIGMGPCGGMLFYLPFGQIQMEAEHLFSGNTLAYQTALSATAVWNIKRNLAFEANYQLKHTKPDNTNTIHVGLRYFF